MNQPNPLERHPACYGQWKDETRDGYTITQYSSLGPKNYSIQFSNFRTNEYFTVTKVSDVFDNRNPISKNRGLLKLNLFFLFQVRGFNLTGELSRQVLNMDTMTEFVSKHCQNEESSLKLKQWCIRINKRHELETKFIYKNYQTISGGKRIVLNSPITRPYGYTNE